MEGDTYDAGDEAADWISCVTGIEGCRIKYMGESNSSRKCVDHYKYSELSEPNEEVLKVCTHASLYILLD